MHGRKAAPAEERQALGKLLLRLSGKAHDHIRGDPGAVEERPEELHALFIPRGIVFPVHPAERGVAAGLHGQVEVGAQVGEGGAPAAKPVPSRKSWPQEEISMPVRTISR